MNIKFSDTPTVWWYNDKQFWAGWSNRIPVNINQQPVFMGMNVLESCGYGDARFAGETMILHRHKFIVLKTRSSIDYVYDTIFLGKITLPNIEIALCCAAYFAAQWATLWALWRGQWSLFERVMKALIRMLSATQQPNA